jgi:predicted transcriptional regulator
MTKWSDFKKELNIPKDQLLLAKAKLQLSELIHDLRKSKQMSQKELGEAIGVSQPYIAKIEDGEENLTIETVVKLLSALNTCLQLRPEKHTHCQNVFHLLKAA